MLTRVIAATCRRYSVQTLVSLTVSVAAIGSEPLRPGEYGATVTDYLNYRPHVTEASAEDRVLQWGREEGIPGLEDVMPAERRLSALTLVHELIARKYLDGLVLPHLAPDAGVKVRAGQPNVVMFGPEGKIEDQEGNVARLGFERFGHYMWPSITKLRDGRLLVRVYVGGEDPRYPKPHEWLNYVSDDGGRNWRHFAVYDEVQQQASRTPERPVSEIAFRLSDGEEIRYGQRTIEFDDPNIKPFATASGVRYSSGYRNRRQGTYYRLGDIPRDKQWIPLFTRKPGERYWTEEKAYWDPDTLLWGREVEVKDGEKTRKICRLVGLGGGPGVQLKDGSLVATLDAQSEMRPVSDLRADGTFGPNSLNYIWRSSDRGRTWKYQAVIPAFTCGPFFFNWRAQLEPRFADGSWLALYRTRGLYSGGGPMFVSRSTDQGKTWSEPKAFRPGSSGVMPGVMLENGIAVRAYGRPGVFLMFCGDGKGLLWGNDVTLVKPWRSQNEANSCNNPGMVATGPDRFIFVYSKFDVPDPWGEPRLAIIAQEFIVSRK